VPTTSEKSANMNLLMVCQMISYVACDIKGEGVSSSLLCL